MYSLVWYDMYDSTLAYFYNRSSFFVVWKFVRLDGIVVDLFIYLFIFSSLKQIRVLYDARLNLMVNLLL